jgi:hypothetical protein
MNSQIDFQFPLLSIKEIRPLLQKGDITFAYEAKALTENGFIVPFYENKGLDLQSFIGKKMKCLLEITKGKIVYKKNDIKNTIKFQYLWHKRLFEYFPDLMKIRDDKQKAYDKKEEFLQELFESTAIKTYAEWGLNGINIGIYQTKPLLSSSIGFFLLNEYEFEEEIDALELNDTIYIEIQEMFLRGICPVEMPKEKSEIQKPSIIKPEPPKQPEKKEEPAQTSKRKFSFFIE